MLIKNLDDTLVNGSMGKVVAFRTIAQQYRVTAGSTAVDNIDKDMTARRYPVVRFELRDALQNKAFQREKLLEEDRWRIEGPKGELIAERAQVSNLAPRRRVGANNAHGHRFPSYCPGP